MWLGWLALAVAAPPDRATLSAAWEAWRPALDTRARYAFRFDDAEWEELAAGRVARRRERLDGTDRVLGVVWVNAGLDTTWLAIHDPHGTTIEDMVHEELPGSTVGRRYLYQRIGLPWPLAARQWVIEVVDNYPLAETTGGRFWERSWTLSDRRGATNEAPNAVWLPVNEGGWFLAEAAGGTLLGYHVRTSVGGIVPEEAALRWSFSTIEGLLTRIAERTTWVRGHYVGDHVPIGRPDGSPVPTFAGP